jgi:hypothetical protein
MVIIEISVIVSNKAKIKYFDDTGLVSTLRNIAKF